MASNQRQRGKPAGLQRLALVAFAAALVLLFVGFAIGQGIGHPSVPSDAVAVVEDAPDDLGTVTDAELQRAIEQAAGQAGVKPTPKPGDDQYDELEETALGELFDRIWIQGEAEEMGISVTPKEVSAELEKLKKQAFKTEAQYKKFLKEANFTEADVNERVKIQILSEKLQEQTAEAASTPSDDEVEEYYEAAKSTQFTQPETRDARSIVTKDESKAKEVAAQLEEDDSAGNWKRLAKQFSTDAATRSNGGLSTGLVDGQTPEPLNAAIFAAPPAQLQGPLKTPNGYTVFEVEKVTAQKVQPLKEVESQIQSQLSEQAQQETTARFIRSYSSTWKSRTFCDPDLTIERCANFKSDGRPPSAPPGCYEADPKGGLPEACPAPVQQVAPALPGTIDVLTPEGQKLAQRPHPAGSGSAEPPAEAGVPPVIPGE